MENVNTSDKERIAELVRKLAEQQAQFRFLAEAMAGTSIPQSPTAEVELTNLLAKAKEEGRKEAVPEIGNIREVSLTGDFAVKLIFNSCRAASSFADVIRRRT